MVLYLTSCLYTDSFISVEAKVSTTEHSSLSGGADIHQNSAGMAYPLPPRSCADSLCKRIMGTTLTHWTNRVIDIKLRELEVKQRYEVSLLM